jgi:hypothetical protein
VAHQTEPGRLSRPPLPTLLSPRESIRITGTRSSHQPIPSRPVLQHEQTARFGQPVSARPATRFRGSPQSVDTLIMTRLAGQRSEEPALG